MEPVTGLSRIKASWCERTAEDTLLSLSLWLCSSLTLSLTKVCWFHGFRRWFSLFQSLVVNSRKAFAPLSTNAKSGTVDTVEKKDVVKVGSHGMRLRRED